MEWYSAGKTLVFRKTSISFHYELRKFVVGIECFHKGLKFHLGIFGALVWWY